MELIRLYKSDFDALYKIMEESFPKDEIRAYSDQAALFDRSEFFAYGVKDESGKLKAFITFWHLNGFTFGEHFAVDPNERGAGLGAKILAEVLKTDGRRFCLEVELPETETAKRRIGFYERMGFTLNDFEYCQPPLGKDRKAVALKIMSTGGKLTQAEFEKVKAEIYINVYGAL
ncbi:MAG TPA: GNAT family N-acetyltransferase [Candidatus Eubacterium faecale]|jgi:GNAT superfamily N-acetyltransferase|uniref:GNAT family N-acetyltransferase n=1 Tax=Candidatus Eubacterium faecale TaxID=2838568 RepID=A0A9D2MHE6_9FIRM|nr:GNAT family N-acetyltransferase [Candidatus Eubacterium faecale]